MSRRTERISDLLREELSSLIQRELKDPRVAHGLVSITEVVVSPDLHHSIVYVSHLGQAGERPAILDGLRHSARWLQEELGRRLRMRRVPMIEFRFDDSIERGARLAALINTLGEERDTNPGA